MCSTCINGISRVKSNTTSRHTVTKRMFRVVATLSKYFIIVHLFFFNIACSVSAGKQFTCHAFDLLISWNWSITKKKKINKWIALHTMKCTEEKRKGEWDPFIHNILGMHANQKCSTHFCSCCILTEDVRFRWNLW